MNRRALGALLVAYGVFGIILTIAGMVVGFDLAARVERLTGTAGDTLQAAARATRAAGDSFASVDSSLAESQTSADTAADLARDASATLDSLAAAMDLSIFGAQPLQPLGAQFSTSADQAEQLAGTLDAVTSSLSDTRTDVSSIGTELATLASRLEALESDAGVDAGAPPLRLFAGLLLAWIGLQSTGCLIYGASLLRPIRPLPPTVV